MHLRPYIFFIILGVYPSLCFSLDELSLYKAGWKKANSNFYDGKSNLVWDSLIQKGTYEEAKASCKSIRTDGKSNWSLATSVDFQLAMCHNTTYSDKNICIDPRSSSQNLTILLDDTKNYWTTQDIEKTDTAVAYNLKENGYKIFRKKDVLNFVCVRKLEDDTLNEIVFIKDNNDNNKNQEEKVFSYYIAPILSGGIYTSNDNDPKIKSTLPFVVAEIRAGYNSKAMNNELYFTLSGELGLDPRYIEYPLISNFLIGPEYFFSNYASLYLAAGLGITRKNIPVSTNNYLTETNYGFGWKGSFIFDLIQWGDYKHENNLSLVLSYTGTRTSAADINHIFLVGLGFRFFN